MKKILTEIQNLYHDEFSGSEDLTLTTPISEMEFDSLETYQFVLALEEHFSVEISDADAEAFKTVGDVVEFVNDNTDAGHEDDSEDEDS